MCVKCFKSLSDLFIFGNMCEILTELSRGPSSLHLFISPNLINRVMSVEWWLRLYILDNKIFRLRSDYWSGSPPRETLPVYRNQGITNADLHELIVFYVMSWFNLRVFYFCDFTNTAFTTLDLYLLYNYRRPVKVKKYTFLNVFEKWSPINWLEPRRKKHFFLIFYLRRYITSKIILLL